MLLLFLAASCLCTRETHAQDTQPGETAGSADTEEQRRVRRLGDVAGEDYKLDLEFPVAPAGDELTSSELDLPDSEQNERLQTLLTSLALRPGNTNALAQLDDLLSEVLADAHTLGDARDLAGMERLLRIVRNVNPDKAGLGAAFERLDNFRELDEWLAAAEIALRDGALVAPPEQNAAHHYRRVLEVDPRNEKAGRGLRAVQQGLIDRALEAARNLDFEGAQAWLAKAAAVHGDQAPVDEARARLPVVRAQQAAAIEQEVLDAIVARQFEFAEFTLIDLIALGGYEDRVANLRERIAEARVYGDFTPGELIYDFFEDSEIAAPTMVVVAAGSFLMGSPDGEEGRSANEGPPHRVTLTRGFALGVHEVTVAQYRRFIEATRYRTRAEVSGSSRIYDEQSGRLLQKSRVNWRHDFEGKRAKDYLPVLHVDWHDAQAYVQWLASRTGTPIRLPTEAEFEYALRAGSVTSFWWGDHSPPEALENLTGDGDKSRSGRRWSEAFRRYEDGFWGPAPVQSFPPNDFGLHDLAGNVSEWVMDCWHDSYVRAPVDGSAWINPGCDRRVVRGGYWASSPAQARSAARLSAGSGLHGARVGFRIARDL